MTWCCCPTERMWSNRRLQANYATAKAGVLGLTKAVAKEWGAFNIRCNALVYGYINTRYAGLLFELQVFFALGPTSARTQGVQALAGLGGIGQARLAG